LEKVVSPERVLTPEIATLARDIADRYAGSLIDVLRLAIPPRHAAAEKRAAGAPLAVARSDGPAPGGWGRYTAGQAFLRALADGQSPRALWAGLPRRSLPGLPA